MFYLINFILFCLIVFFQFQFQIGFFWFFPMNFLLIFLILSFLSFKKINPYYFFFLTFLSAFIYDLFSPLFFGAYLIIFLITLFFMLFFNSVIEKGIISSQILFSLLVILIFNFSELIFTSYLKKPFFLPLMFNTLLTLIFAIWILIIGYGIRKISQ